MTSLITALQHHLFWFAVALYWLFSSAVSAMPVPNGSGNFYKWAYAFLHTIAGDLAGAFASKIPGIANTNTPAPPAQKG